MASDPDPLASAGSRCILNFGPHKEICKGETQEDMANHALHTLQRLAPARVCGFNPAFGTIILQCFNLQRAARHSTMTDLFLPHMTCVRRKE